MIGEICDHIHNYFTAEDEIISGAFTITDGALTVEGLQEGQYFRIVGSVFNDGIYAYPTTALTDETFTGEVWPMKVPPALKVLAQEIADWVEKYGEAVNSPFQSESVNGVYSYKKAYRYNEGSDPDTGTWRTIFRARLNRWRKIA